VKTSAPTSADRRFLPAQHWCVFLQRRIAVHIDAVAAAQAVFTSLYMQVMFRAAPKFFAEKF